MSAKGFAVVCQDVRGRWDSAGDFYPYAAEAADGAHAISWVADQPWCSGKVGTYGFSYGGATQLLAATKAPPALAAHAPGMTRFQLLRRLDLPGRCPSTLHSFSAGRRRWGWIRRAAPAMATPPPCWPIS